jgi:hypothetical protein
MDGLEAGAVLVDDGGPVVGEAGAGGYGVAEG